MNCKIFHHLVKSAFTKNALEHHISQHFHFKVQSSVAAHFKANILHYILTLLFIRKDFNYLGNLVTNDASCEQIKSTIVLANASFNKKMLFLSTMVEMRKMLHLGHSFAWC